MSSVVRHAFAVALLAASLAATVDAGAAPGLKHGIVEHAGAFYGDNDEFFGTLRELRPQVLRVNLNWGGQLGVARRRPVDDTDPADPAYRWGLYDRIVLEAAKRRIEIAFSIFGTPPWANGGGRPSRAPRDPYRLFAFSWAAATRYSGTYKRSDGVVLPRVRLWIAWNEPNLNLGLVPQYRRVRGRWVIQSAIDYARICNAITEGVHATLLRGQRVACGVTAPRGNNNPRAPRPSISPIAFLRAMAKAGARGFDAYAHQAYYGGPGETPATPPLGPYAITLANIDRLVREVQRLYGPRRLWITEYGYQTYPPDAVFGVSWALQARYLTQAYEIARRHPRIDLMLWFLLYDEADVERWQSGLISVDGRRKPAFYAFQRLARVSGNRGDAGAPPQTNP
jgi:hypothetical protein